MSIWTYVTGAIRVDAPGVSDVESEYIIRKAIKSLPVVHGGESDAAVNAVPDISIDDISFRDERGLERKYSGPMFWTDDPDYFHRHQYYLVTISGSLRHADFETALKETEKLLFRLAKKLFIEDISVTVHGDFCRSYTFSNAAPFGDVYEIEQDEQAWREDLQRRIWRADEDGYFFYEIEGEDHVFIYYEDAEEWKKEKKLKGKIKKVRIM